VGGRGEVKCEGVDKNGMVPVAACKKIFWDHFSKSLVAIQVFTSGTWAPIGLSNVGYVMNTAV